MRTFIENAGIRKMRSMRGAGRTRLFVLWAMVLLSAATNIALASTTSPKAGQTGGYRLSGVMLVGKERIGFLEVPAGGQVLVRQGSVIDGGRVTLLGDRRMRIEFPTRALDLELEAGAGMPPETLSADAVMSEDTQGNIYVRQVNKDQMAAALDAIQKPATASAGKTKAGPARSDAEMSRRFAAVAHLPPDARILAVNEQPVNSAAGVISLVDQRLAQGESIVLTLESRPGERPGRVYLNLQSD